MTIGQLSARTGVPVKALRRHEGMGLIYTLGRSSGGYRLFDESAVACVRSIRGLRALGLTEAEITQLAGAHVAGHDISQRLSEVLRSVRARLDARAAELARQQRRLDEFEARHRTGLAGPDGCPLPIDLGSAA
jgi:DNA-binding transcriptional MerR regulator